MGDDTEPTQTTTTQYMLSPQQQELMNLALPGVRQFAASVPQRYPGQTTAGFDPSQVAGQEMALGAAGTQAGLAGNAAAANNFLLGDIWNPASNPHLTGAIDAAVRPVTERYQQVVRPAIRDEFAGAGQVFGGSRRNIAEATGARDYMRTVGDTASKLVQDQYANNLGAQTKALALAPQTQQAQLAPGLTTSGVGDVRQSLAQSFLNDDVAGFNYDQLAPFLQSKEILAMLSGIPGGGSTSTSVGNVPQSGGVRGALGGAAAGASLGSIFPGVGTGIGALGGGLLGYFG